MARVSILQLCSTVILSFRIYFMSCEEARHITFNIPILNKKLRNHEIAYHNVESRDICMELCYIEPNCVSINYYERLGDGYDNCELSSSDHHLSAKEDFVHSNGAIYAAILNNCHGVKCPEDNMTCQSGFNSQAGSYRCVTPLCYEGPLGMEDKRIPDSSISASSEYGRAYLAKNGRLGLTCEKCLWAPKIKRAGEYLQVDLGAKMAVSRVATQGNHWVAGTSAEYMKNYWMAYSQDGSFWQNYTKGGMLWIFDGNTDTTSVFTNVISPYIRARHVRVVGEEWQGYPSMSIELYGCKLP